MEKVNLTSDKFEFTMKPSQWVSTGWIILSLIAITVSVVSSIPFISIISGVFAIGWVCNRILISCWKYDFNERTVSERKGVFNVHTREIHYFRIKSIRVEEPLFFRMFGLCTYNVITSDPLIPILRIYAIEDNGTYIRDYLKKKAIYWRNEMGVKETDFHNF
jgi:uncharacterized membrane protein YdbT with pleckstrin-like domain